MIRLIEGTLIDKSEGHCIIMANGVGYKIFVPINCSDSLPEYGNTVTLHTYLAVREDAMNLYGFIEPEELAVFELMLNVSGIGPKIALGLIGTIKPTQFYLSVLNEQVSHLTKVPGIGKKSAQRIILELKEKVKDFTASQYELSENYQELANKASNTVGLSKSQTTEELKAALSTLGYTNREIDKTVESLYDSVKADMEMENLLRLALQKLNKH